MTRLCFPKHSCKVRVICHFSVLGRGRAGPLGSISDLDGSVFPLWAHPWTRTSEEAGGLLAMSPQSSCCWMLLLAQLWSQWNAAEPWPMVLKTHAPESAAPWASWLVLSLVLFFHQTLVVNEMECLTHAPAWRVSCLALIWIVSPSYLCL